ncbi:MAG: CAP domain-containing protein [Bacteroidota bacterium]
MSFAGYYIRVHGVYALAVTVMLLMFSCSGWRHNADFNKSELKTIRKMNTARIAYYMGPRSREIIRLCNLVRNNKPLYFKYVKSRYGEEYVNTSYETASVGKKQKPILRPSFGLWLSAKSHAVFSGMIAYEGHGGFEFRVFLFGNLNCIFTTFGENCYYGRMNPAEAMKEWMNSAGHRGNILQSDFCRTGVAGGFHFEYGYNRVQIFSGPKLIDLFRLKKLK